MAVNSAEASHNSASSLVESTAPFSVVPTPSLLIKPPSFPNSISPLMVTPARAPVRGVTDVKPDSFGSGLVLILRNDTLSKVAAMGLVLSAANVRGWTTGSGMEGPAGSDHESAMERVSTFPWSLFTKCPRRRMRVAFTCNVCGQRTTRAINPHAYTDGTVFVQCCGCNVFHKLVDNLNLFHETKCYVDSSFKFLDLDEDKRDDI